VLALDDVAVLAPDDVAVFAADDTAAIGSANSAGEIVAAGGNTIATDSLARLVRSPTGERSRSIPILLATRMPATAAAISVAVISLRHLVRRTVQRGRRGGRPRQPTCMNAASGL